MLRVLGSDRSPMCDGLSRRGFLQVGGLGLLGIPLSDWLVPQVASAASGRPGYARDTSVIFLFLAGGPSQFETFDPKPDGPGSSTSLAGHLATRLPGVRFATYFPELAKWTDRLTIVRNFQTHHAEHDGAHKQLMTGDLTVQDGKPIREPGLGAVYARIAGAIHPSTGMLSQAVIPPTTRHVPGAASFTQAYESVVEGAQPAWLGPAYTPLELRVSMAEGQPREKKNRSGQPLGNPLLDDLEPRLGDLRMSGRRALLDQLDRMDRRIDASGVMEQVDHSRAAAIEFLRSGTIRNALDLDREDPATLAAYDTEHFRNYRCNDQSRFERDGPSIGVSLGRQLLLARRLCEAGCGFVTVIHPNWDFHARKGIPNMPEGMSVLAPPLDHAVAAYLQDTENRGLSEKILLVITGEFGRTPNLDSNLGRHHWPKLCPLVLAGGGLNHGQVVGQSDRRGGEPNGQPVTIADLHATVLQTMFDLGQMRLDSTVPRELLLRATAGQPIAGVL